MDQLLVIRPGRPVRRVALAARTLAGSLALCDCQVEDAGVAREHLEVVREPGGGYRLGVLARPPETVKVNGRAVRSVLLNAGDMIEMPGALLVVDSLADAVPAVPASARESVFSAAARIFELAEQILDEKPTREALERLLDVSMALFMAPRALLLDVDPSDQPPRLLATRGDWPAGRSARMSRTLLSRLRRNPVPVLVADVADDSGTSAIESISVEVRSIIAGPVMERDRMLGVVYLEGPAAIAPFGEPERRFLERFSAFAGRLLGHARSAGELRADRERYAELHRVSLDAGDLEDLIGQSAGMEEVRRQVRQVARTDVTTLILGESGTGKELVARAIHHLSSRAERPFVAVNCTALPDDLAESELFGHVAGAFSGATRDRPGRFELADGGTLFLDEIGDLSPAIQAKLLRALQERVIQRLGEAKDRRVDLRIVAATNAPLPERIGQGRFREDLFYRLRVFTIRMPPLRERLEDLPLLSARFCRQFAARQHRALAGLDPGALALLAGHSWPGNVRELSNVIEQAVVREASDRITPSSLSFALDGPRAPRAAAEATIGSDFDLSGGFEIARARWEKWLIEKTLSSERGDLRGVLRALAMPRGTFYRKCAQLGIEPGRYRSGGRD